ncbi:S8 family peptidase [Pseudazoarcus pumilus]|uniref:Peptidase S8/S53 domain-containing protein n=1 Tax=Pseudazoarcus pumilus TaxID=2067960 RepID=A0A2I6S8W3_9RHOO|nr:S8 family peptidase [Pseudazoarcus pumilus]AUN95687.1 hypothetical protein C0099_12560 [Pseudazoarcus pumilus]
MTARHLALALCALTLAATPLSSQSQTWSGAVATAPATSTWLLAVQVHPRNAIADMDVPPDEALEAIATATGTTVAFVGRATSRGPFLLRLSDGDDFDAISDGANAVRMLDDVLWVSILSEADAAAPVTPSSGGPAQAAGETVSRILVNFRDPATQRARSRQDALPELLIEAMRRQAGSNLELVRAMSGGAWVFDLPQALPEPDAVALIARLRAMPQVASVSASQRVLPQLEPNDPYFPITGSLGQYNLVAPGTAGPWGGPVFGIDAVNAWNITTGSTNNRVAVLDTGVLFNHPDIAGRFMPGYDFVDNDSNASDPGDYCNVEGQESASSWHGTHISGTIAANTNDGVGAAGVDWATRIVPVRVLGQCGGMAEDVIDGMRWAAGLPVPGTPVNANPVRVINLSLAGIGACTASWQQVIDDVTAAGALVIVSAGNYQSPIDNYSPASCNGVITVVASDPNGDKASYSNFGGNRLPELAAPGGDLGRFGDVRAGIIAAGNDGTTTPKNNVMMSMSGTSMAVPHVVGTASLMLAINPALSPSQLFSMITATENLTAFAHDSDFTFNYPLGGRGILNAYKAVQAAQATVQPPAPGGAAPMLLRDAIYLYGQPLTANGGQNLVGVDCDVFQLVLDVTSGHTDLAMGQASTLAGSLAGATPYPDRIFSSAAMFAYALYGPEQVKSFTARDAITPESEDVVGTATAFGYCFSRNPDARVYAHDKTSCTNVYSDGRQTACTATDNGVGGAAPSAMTLRDAIYLYGEDVRADGQLQLGGDQCDVLQLVLDVESGHADLTMTEGASSFDYPDRIFAAADMFAYALYSDAPHKRFGLGQHDGDADGLVGNATAFAYCYSTQPDAYVYWKDGQTPMCTRSNGQETTCP